MTALGQNPTIFDNNKTNIILKNKNPNLPESKLTIPSPNTAQPWIDLDCNRRTKEKTQITKIPRDELGNHLP